MQSQAIALAAATNGVVHATISDGDIETLSNLQEPGNAYTITVTDASVDAEALNTLNSKTTVAINGSSITSLKGLTSERTLKGGGL